MRFRRNSFSRSGFTLIEMLVVIGIIIVLAAMGFLGFRSLVTIGNRNQTKARLHDMQAFLVEYENATALKRQPRWTWIAGTPPTKYFITNAIVPPSTTPYNFWRDSDPLNAGDQPLYPPLGPLEDGDPDAYESLAVLNTAEAMREMAQMPSAKKLLASLNSDYVVTINEPPRNSGPLIFQVVLDAWHHPIIFVPAGGIASVALGDVSDLNNPYVITSTKTYSQSLITGTNNPVPPNARPFFASAGPDGRFGFADRNNDGVFDSNDIIGGDDNLYSFEN